MPTNQTYDYIVIGSGAGGIPIADRLSEAGHSVLLLEKGPVSSGRWGGTMKPKWLEGTNLTRFDVPGLCNQIWHDSIGVACTDLDQMAGCVLGGGTAVNAGLWWKPNPRDWDSNFPAGWSYADMANATQAVFGRIPGTTHPSMDGKLYTQQGFEMLGGGLRAAGWKEVVPNDHPELKNHTFGHSTFMYAGGERGGPLATYLVSASQRPAFAVWPNTMARRVVRSGGHATGVEIECTSSGSGHAGVVQLTPGTGRVILSAGTFGSAKLLLRSGIGPADQLNVVKGSSDGPTMIGSDQWIDLPVGYNLNDHVGVSRTFRFVPVRVLLCLPNRAERRRTLKSPTPTSSSTTTTAPGTTPSRVTRPSTWPTAPACWPRPRPTWAPCSGSPSAAPTASSATCSGRRASRAWPTVSHPLAARSLLPAADPQPP